MDERIRTSVWRLIAPDRTDLPEVCAHSARWTHRAIASAHARIRVLVKRILRKYGYPPDLEDAALQYILQQAEMLSAAWAS